MSDTFAYDVFLSHTDKDKAVMDDIAERHENKAPRT